MHTQGPDADLRGLEGFVRYQSHGIRTRKEMGLRMEIMKTPGSLLLILQGAFLPHGYPESVSDDYLTYQIWDTVQVCCN